MDEVRAAGGVVWRRGASGGLQVVLVHRPHYDDWTFPKGKVDPGETDDEAAHREVREEAGVEVQLGPPVGDVHYIDHRGRRKVARYWAMTVTAGEVHPDNEIDVAEWVDVAEARERLSYPHDHPVLDRAMALDDHGGLG